MIKLLRSQFIVTVHVMWEMKDLMASVPDCSHTMTHSVSSSATASLKLS